MKRTAVLCVVAGLGTGAAEAKAQGECDRRLQVADAAANPLGYRWRGNRCEGTYVRPISGTAFAVLSLIAAPGDATQPDALPDTLTLAWPAGTDSVRLRAHSLRSRLNYRMDALVHRAALFRWPTETLSELRLRRAEVGLLGWTVQQLGAVRADVMQPLEIRSAGAAPVARGHYQSVIMPGSELTELVYSVRRLDASGNVTATVIADRDVRRAFYPPARPVVVDFEVRGDTGLYALDLSARLRDGTSASERLVFRHVRP